MSELRQRISRASRAQGVTALVGKLANLLLSIVLARLLYPEDYGLFTITLIVTGLANMVSNFGFQSYIIQAEELTQESLNTCFTLNVVFSLALGLVVAAIGWAWPHPPYLLPQMFAMYGLLVFLSGLSYIELALLKRDLEFAKSSKVDLTFTIVSMGGRVAFAAAHFGALCFPLGDVVGALVRWLMVRRMSHTPLRMARLNGPASREALWFGLHSTSIGVASFVANQTDKMLVTANHSVASVGYYAFGSNTAGIFYNAFIVPQTGVYLAMFARLRDDHEGARAVLAVSTRLIFSLALPINALLLLEPERIVQVLFGARWVDAAPLVRVFAIDYLVRSMFSGITGLQLSFGLAAQAARTKWGNALVFVAFLLIATWLRVGIVGYAIAYVSANLVATFHNLHVNGRLLAIRWGAYSRNLLPPATIALASTLAWAAMRPIATHWSTWPALIGLAGAWLLTYALLSLGFNRMLYTTLLAAFRPKSRGVGQ